MLPGQWQLLSPLSLPVKLDRKPTRNLQPLRWRGLATTARRHRRGGSPRDREPPLNPAKEKRRERCLFRKLGSSVLSLFLSLSLSLPLKKESRGNSFFSRPRGKKETCSWKELVFFNASLSPPFLLLRTWIVSTELNLPIREYLSFFPLSFFFFAYQPRFF